uniref:EF-hand domain-containing protein n=1 Tax=Kalanchoe fedtschenkoi TaxID=63787 RepID=A0A7N0RAN4_KALFE
MIATKPKPDSAPESVFSKLCRKLSKGKRSGRSSLSVNPKINGQVSLRSIFRYFDLNGDGKITPEELQTCVRTVGGDMTAEEAKTAVKSSDLDGDGMLGFDEFEKLMEGAREEEERERELKEAFHMFEIEEDGGGITAGSLKRMLRRLGELWSMEDCRMMIREFDLDGNGVITFNEFVVMMR